jgi:hypothetical protein
VQECSQKARFCPAEEGDSSGSEVSAKANFLAKLSKKEIYIHIKKVALSLGLINLINVIACPMGMC